MWNKLIISEEMVFAISKEGKRRILDSGYVNAGLKSKELLLNLLFRVYHTAPCQLPSKTTDPTQKLVPLPLPPSQICWR